MNRALRRLLDSPLAVPLAAAISLALGLVFTFVWAPHPWGWKGIDQYHELARGLARGEPFATTDVPWGYAYYVAAFYALVGEQAWIPVLVQVVVNASVPVLLYLLVAPAAGRATAALSALLAGIFSFNTVYASTQSSDALCTVLFLLSLLLFVRGLRAEHREIGEPSHREIIEIRETNLSTGLVPPSTRRTSVVAFAAAGLLSGLVPQFRPNMILFPLVLAAVALYLRPGAQRAMRMAVFLALAALALTPWVVRNYRLTGLFLPTSTHGGVQLWYGTLQVGPYLHSRAHNPRSAFESAAFDYTSLTDRSIFISADPRTCGSWDTASIALVYWTDRDPRRVRVRSDALPSESLRFEIPGQPAPTTLFYFFEAAWPSTGSGTAVQQVTPPQGEADPLVFFVSDDHLGDLDRQHHVLDIFDVVGLMRGAASGEREKEAALAAVVNALLAPEPGHARVPSFGALRSGDTGLTLQLTDGSTVTVPPDFSGRVTDLVIAGNLASALVSRSRPLGVLVGAPAGTPDPCRLLEHIRVNDVFYRKEPHQMRRYTALALDNIARDPVAFLAASAYRAGRLFIIRGSDDRWTAQQFSGSTLAYGVGLVLSTTYLLAFLAGVFVAWRQRSPLLYLLIPIVYVPLTICFVLTNMRYTITVQPLMFAFVALAAVTWMRLDEEVGRS